MALADWFTPQTMLTAIITAAGTALINHARGRVREWQYTVNHDRIGVTADDPIFGKIEVKWQGNDLPNLYVSKIEVINTTGKHFENVALRVFTGKGGLLLSQRTQLGDRPDTLEYTPGYADQIKFPPGGNPTEAQKKFHWSQREYKVPTMNRGDRVTLEYLVGVPANQTPEIWLSTAHPGLKCVYQLPGRRLFGVSVRQAAFAGIGVAIAVTVVSIYFLPSWGAATVALCFGLACQAIGAQVIKTARAIVRMMVG